MPAAPARPGAADGPSHAGAAGADGRYRAGVPELVEVERYRRLAEEVLGATVSAVGVLDPYALRGLPSPDDLAMAVVGSRLARARRTGKLLLLDLEPARGRPGSGHTVGLRFGMTGTLLLDGRPGVDRLEYSPRGVEERWVRVRIDLAGPRRRHHRLEVHDPRRLGRVVLDPDESALGPDALVATLAELGAALCPPAGAEGRGGGPPLKARLMDQSRLAGVGNLTADEVLWRAGLSPDRPACALARSELRRLHGVLRRTLAVLEARGGSHAGDLMAQRRHGGRCPRDGAPLARATVGGRTTWWCPAHQR